MPSRPGLPRIGVDLLFADGEDYGSFHDTTETLLGSRRYARTARGGQAPRFAVVWDIVADRDQRFVHEWYSTTGAPDVVATVWRIAGRLGYADHFVDEAGAPVIDDHVPLQKAGIPAIDVIDVAVRPIEQLPPHSPGHPRQDRRRESGPGHARGDGRDPHRTPLIPDCATFS